MSAPLLWQTYQVLLCSYLFGKWSFRNSIVFAGLSPDARLTWRMERVGWRECWLSRGIGRRARVLSLEPHLPQFHLSKCELLLLSAPHFPPFPLVLPPSSLLLFTFLSSYHQRLMWQGKGWSVRIDLGENCFTSFLLPSLLRYYTEWRIAYKYLTFSLLSMLHFQR